MTGISRAHPGLPFADLQVVLLDDVVETVVTHHVDLTEILPVLMPQLATTYATILLADTPDVIHYK